MLHDRADQQAIAWKEAEKIGLVREGLDGIIAFASQTNPGS